MKRSVRFDCSEHLSGGRRGSLFMGGEGTCQATRGRRRESTQGVEPLAHPWIELPWAWSSSMSRIQRLLDMHRTHVAGINDVWVTQMASSED
jgi:hypothetical protein